ncbi:MAG: hypothetical protein GEV28_23535 [Actinophytocola sp.]|nr:hypothetical protein [Actinophytocola sp.]
MPGDPVTSTGAEARPVAVQLAFAGALGAWYAYWFVRRRDSSLAHLPYLLGAAALWAVMAALDPALLWVGAASLVPYCMRHALWAAGGFVALGAAWLWQRFATDGVPVEVGPFAGGRVEVSSPELTTGMTVEVPK